MEILLDAIEARIPGSLIEKEITTPEYYPLSLNALINACNQKSSREPVMRLDEIAVRQALSRLEELNLVSRVDDSRVPKFEHRARQSLDLKRPEIAVLCLLLLRGPQTAGELRNRSERLYKFDDIASVQTVLERLSRSESGENGRPRPALVTPACPPSRRKGAPLRAPAFRRARRRAFGFGTNPKQPGPRHGPHRAPRIRNYRIARRASRFV